jgi:hypothetical protein
MVSYEGRVPVAPVEARSAGAVERCAAAVERCAAAVAAQTWGHSAVASGEART